MSFWGGEEGRKEGGGGTEDLPCEGPKWTRLEISISKWRVLVEQIGDNLDFKQFIQCFI